MNAAPNPLEAPAIRERVPVAESTRREVVGLVMSAIRRAGAAQHRRVSEEARSGLEGIATDDQMGDLTLRIGIDDGWLEVEIGSRRRGQPGAGATEEGEPFGSWLRHRLRDVGLSQESAARRIGVSARTVGRWIRGDTEPRYRDLSRVRVVMGGLPAP